MSVFGKIKPSFGVVNQRVNAPIMSQLPIPKIDTIPLVVTELLKIDEDGK